MGEPAKFTFDRCFSNGRARPEPPEAVVERRLRAEFENTLALARKEAFEQGRAEGEAAARKSLDAELAAAAGRLAGSAEKLLKGIDATCRAEAAKALKVARMAAEKLAAGLLQRYPDEVLSSIFAECIEHVRDAPHLAIRVNDALAEQMQKRVTAIARERGYTGNIVVLGDPETRSGDCRIEWADGGVTRDFGEMSRLVADAVDRHLNIHAVPAGRKPAAPAQPASNGAADAEAEPQGVLA
ncbi:MAG: FliH/SctL family protein [Hyphomicrobiales bacterium]